MDEVIWARPERGTRGPKPTYGRDELAAAGIRLADAEGLDAVSMRRIAGELGTGTTTLYRYVAKKEDLFDLMVDAVLGEEPPPPRTGDWRTDLTALAHRTRARSLRHPWLTALSALRPALGPNSLDWMEFTLASVDGLGLTPDEMIITTGTVTTFVLGSVVVEVAERGTATSRSHWMATRGAHGDAIAYGDQHPALARIMIEAQIPHRDNPADDLFTEGLDRLMDGLAARIDKPRQR